MPTRNDYIDISQPLLSSIYNNLSQGGMNKSKTGKRRKWIALKRDFRSQWKKKFRTGQLMYKISVRREGTFLQAACSKRKFVPRCWSALIS